MKQKHLIFLVAIVLLLGVVYRFINDNSNYHPLSPDVKLLGNIEPGKVAKVVIAKGNDSTELVKVNSEWVVSNRNNFHTDNAKVNAMFLKLFDLTVSQKIPAVEADLVSFGLTDEQVKSGKSKVSFFNDQGSELASVYLGELRKTKSGSTAMPSVGQYVRRGDNSDVYLVAETLTFAADAPSWLESTVTNVLQSSILEVQQYSSSSEEVADNAAEFVVKRDSSGDANSSKLVVAQGLPAEKAADDASLSQLVSGLENLKLSDVLLATGEEAKDLVFDKLTRFTTNNGLVYVVQSVEKDNATYVKLTAHLDDNIVANLNAALTAAEEQAKKVKEEETTSSSSSGDGAKPAAAENQTSEEQKNVSAPAPIKPATSSAVDAVNKDFGNWVYKLDTFRGKKFRMSPADLIKKEEPKAPAK